MTLLLIAALTAVCLCTGLVYLRLFAKRRSALGVSFVVIWMLHYVVGSIFTLLSRDRTFSLLEFEEFEWAYLLAVLAGLYFLLVYGQLLYTLPGSAGVRVRYRVGALRPIVLFIAAGLVFGVLLVLRIGVSDYFSPELAFFRARLGELAGEGVGVYYYLAALLLPATMMAHVCVSLTV